MQALNISRISFLIVLIVFLSSSFYAQSHKSEETQLTKEERFEKMESKLKFPLIKAGRMAGVLPVDFISKKPDPDTKIKLVFDFTKATANKAQATNVNEGLEEVARILNLHVASGIKPENIESAVVFHAGSLPTIMDESYYEKVYKGQNPNIALMKQLYRNGTELLVCGQSVMLRELNPANFLSFIEFSLSAKTSLSQYQSEGYILFPIN